MGCHVNHVFKHSHNKFFPVDKFFWCMPGIPMNHLIPMESCPGVAR